MGMLTNTPPIDTPEYLYSLGKAQGMKELTTCPKARAEAQKVLHSKIEHKIDHLFAPNHEPPGGFSPAMQDFMKSARDTVFRSSLLYTETELIYSHFDKETQVCRELIGVPTAKVVNAIDESLSKNDSLYTRFTRSRNYETLMNNFHKGFENN